VMLLMLFWADDPKVLKALWTPVRAEVILPMDSAKRSGPLESNSPMP